MSRIILSKYPGTDESHIVVGWDRPLSTYYWQEFNKEPEGGEEKWEDPANCEWEEMAGYAGYFPNELPTIQSLMQSAPDHVWDLVTEEVRELLREHSMDPNTGSVIVDLTKSNVVMGSFKVEVQTLDSGESWSGNGLRFPTREEAEEDAKDLMARWMMVKEWRVVESTDKPNYTRENGMAVRIGDGS